MKTLYGPIYGYPIHIGRGAFCQLQYLLPQGKHLWVVDSEVARLYAPLLQDKNVYVVPHGEGSKDLSVYQALLAALEQAGLGRQDTVVAVGGGVVGDLVGFAAATYLRGVQLWQVPTTLVAMIDSSLGHKNGLNFGGYKNQIGTFYAPQGILMDLDFLLTLPKEEWRSGRGEMLKYACLLGGDEGRLLLEGEVTEELVALCVEYKNKLVEKDPYDRGERRLLNLGHTFGHAYESLSGMTIPHGVAVAMGLSTLAAHAFRSGTMPIEEYQLLQEALEDLDLPKAPVGALGVALSHDKKSTQGGIDMVVMERMGACRVERLSYEEVLCRYPF